MTGALGNQTGKSEMILRPEMAREQFKPQPRSRPDPHVAGSLGGQAAFVEDASWQAI